MPEKRPKMLTKSSELSCLQICLITDIPTPTYTPCNNYNLSFSFVGNLTVQSLLGFGQDVNGVMTSNQDRVIENEQPIECDCWLNPSLVAMAVYVLNTCPVHCRYVRHGRGEHNVKAVEEFFITSKQVNNGALIECEGS